MNFFQGQFGSATDNWSLTGILGHLNALFQRVFTNAPGNANVTIAAATIVGGLIDRSGTAGGGFTDTTDTAANIIAALPPNTPSGWAGTVRYMNRGTGQTATLAPGSGVTIVVAGSNQNASIANNNWRDFQLLVTGSPAQGQTAAVTLTNLGQGVM